MLSELNFGDLEDATALGLPLFTTVLGEIRNLHTHPRQDRSDSRVPGVTTLSERAAIRHGWNEGVKLFRQLEKAAAEPDTKETKVALGYLSRVSGSEPITGVWHGGEPYPYEASYFAPKADGLQCELLTTLKSQFALVVIYGALKFTQDAKNKGPTPAPRVRTQGPSAPAGVHRPRTCEALLTQRENNLEFPLVMSEYAAVPKNTAKLMANALEAIRADKNCKLSLDSPTELAKSVYHVLDVIRPHGVSENDALATVLIWEVAPHEFKSTLKAAPWYADILDQRGGPEKDALKSTIVGELLSFRWMVSSFVEAYFTSTGAYAQLRRALYGVQQKKAESHKAYMEKLVTLVEELKNRTCASWMSPDRELMAEMYLHGLYDTDQAARVTQVSHKEMRTYTTREEYLAAAAAIDDQYPPSSRQQSFHEERYRLEHARKSDDQWMANRKEAGVRRKAKIGQVAQIGDDAEDVTATGALYRIVGERWCTTCRSDQTGAHDCVLVCMRCLRKGHRAVECTGTRVPGPDEQTAAGRGRGGHRGGRGRRGGRQAPPQTTTAQRPTGAQTAAATPNVTGWNQQTVGALQTGAAQHYHGRPQISKTVNAINASQSNVLSCKPSGSDFPAMCRFDFLHLPDRKVGIHQEGILVSEVLQGEG